MTEQAPLPQSGGTWERQADGTLVQTEKPTRRREPWEPEEEPAPPEAAPAARRGRTAPPADPVTES